MAFRLVRILPDGTEKPSAFAQPTKKLAAMFAGMTLHDNGRATKQEAQRFSASLSGLPLGETAAHEASGYSFRIERAD